MKDFTFCYSSNMINWCWLEIELWDVSIEHEYEIDLEQPKEYEFNICVAYRDPYLPEWILARWYWNDKWIWTPDWVFPE